MSSVSEGSIDVWIYLSYELLVGQNSDLISEKKNTHRFQPCSFFTLSENKKDHGESIDFDR